MEFKDIVYTADVEKGIAKLVINRPEARNALNTQTIVEIEEVIEPPRHDKVFSSSSVPEISLLLPVPTFKNSGNPTV